MDVDVGPPRSSDHRVQCNNCPAGTKASLFLLYLYDYYSARILLDMGCNNAIHDRNRITIGGGGGLRGRTVAVLFSVGFGRVG